MIPSEGLIGSFGGQMVIVAILLGVGFLAFVVFMGIVFVRKAPPLTTQTNLMTGVREHGIGWWAVVIAIFTMGGQVAFGVADTLITGVDRLSAAFPLWWVFAAVTGVSVVCWLVVRKVRRMQERAYKPPVVAAQPQPLQHPIGAFLPEGVDQWDAR